jgi:hypothetical protein
MSVSLRHALILVATKLLYPVKIDTGLNKRSGKVMSESIAEDCKAPTTLTGGQTGQAPKNVNISRGKHRRSALQRRVKRHVSACQQAGAESKALPELREGAADIPGWTLHMRPALYLEISVDITEISRGLVPFL